MSNAWITYLQVRNSGGKLPVMPYNISGSKLRRLKTGPRIISLLVG